MRQLCVLCKHIHDSTNWKYGEYVSTSGTKYGWFCNRYFKPSFVEWVPQRIKDQRNEFASSLIQPFRNGELSREYVDKYGTEKLNVTKDDIRKSKKVWKDVLPTNWERSK